MFQVRKIFNCLSFPHPLLIAMCVLPFLLSAGQSQTNESTQVSNQRSSTLKTVSDMLVVPDGNGVVVYVADNISGAIFYLRRTDEQSGPIKFEDFQLLVSTAPSFPAPSGLAYWNGKLIGCDPSTDTIFEIDIRADAPTPKLVEHGAVLRNPEKIAVSETGNIAVSEDGDQRIVYFVPGQAPKEIKKRIGDLTRLIFDGRYLIVLDGQAAGHLRVIDPESSVPQWMTPSSPGSVQMLSSAFTSQSISINDFTFHRGIYYVAGEDGIGTFVRPPTDTTEGSQFLPISLPKNSGSNISKIAASESSLYLLELSNRVIWSIVRPIPVEVDFPKPSDRDVFEQLDVLERMLDKGMLLRRTIVAKKDYSTLESFVDDVLFDDDRPRAGAEEINRISRFLCQFNNWNCSSRETNQRIEFYKKISNGEEIKLPSAVLRNYSTEYRGGQDNLEKHLMQREMIPLSPQLSVLRPGMLIQVEEDQQPRPRIVEQCNLDLSSATIANETYFANELKIEPRNLFGSTGRPITTKELEELGIAKIIVSYRKVFLEKLKLHAEEKAEVCDYRVWSDSHYVIDGVISASSARYRFLDKAGNTVFPNPKKLAALLLPGGPDVNKQWSWIISKRINLGYTAYKRVKGPDLDSMVVSYLKPISTRLHAVKLTMLVESKSVQNVLQDLNGWASTRSAKFYTYSTQDMQLVGGQSLALSETPDDKRSEKKLGLPEICHKREEVMKLIHFSKESVKDLSGLKIGIVENPTSINERHSCFFNGEWAWWGMVDDVKSDERDTEQIVEDEFDLSRDHGTHVAGIIGARRELSGMVPAVKLIRVDPKQLLANLRTAAVDTQVFNFSIHLSGFDYTSVVAPIMGTDGLNEILLVVAAGNDARDYGAPGFSVPHPVAWLRDLPNRVLVVGASTNTETPARSTGKKNTGTNYSKKYVQLFAPGEKIYSATSNGLYAQASGSSQAAPQVSAVAVILRASGLSAAWIKATLVYTADWYEPMMNDVWGGVLNAKRAMAAVSDSPNSIWFDPDGEPQSVPLFRKGDFKIKIKAGALINDPNEKIPHLLEEDLEIRFDDVLRVQNLGEGLFRIVYLDKSGVIHMLVNAHIESGLQCALIKDGNRTVVNQHCRVERDKDYGEIDFNHIVDYIRHAPIEGKSIRFLPPQ